MNTLFDMILNFVNGLGKTTKAWILVIIAYCMLCWCKDIAAWFAMKFVLSLLIVLPVLGLLMFMFVAWYCNRFFEKKDNVIGIIIESLINVLYAVIGFFKWVFNEIIKLLDK